MSVRFANLESGAKLVVHALLCETAAGTSCGHPLCGQDVAALKLQFHDLCMHACTCNSKDAQGHCAKCAQWRSLERTRERYRPIGNLGAPSAPVPTHELPSVAALPTSSAPTAIDLDKPKEFPLVVSEAETDEWPDWLLDVGDDLFDVTPSGMEEVTEDTDEKIERQHAGSARSTKRRTHGTSTAEASPADRNKRAKSNALPDEQHVRRSVLIEKLPPSIFDSSPALLEYRAAYRKFRMGAARGSAGEAPTPEGGEHGASSSQEVGSGTTLARRPTTDGLPRGPGCSNALSCQIGRASCRERV